MDVATQTAPAKSNVEIFADMGLIPPPAKNKGPRPASSYRAARRNHVKAHHQLPAWRQVTAANANDVAGIASRAAVASGAREAAAKALVEAAVRFPGMRRDAVIIAGVLDYYRREVKHTRPVNRIIRDLEGRA